MNAPDPHRALMAAELLRSALDCASAGVLVHDDQGVIVDVNPAAERMLGAPSGRLAGRSGADPRWVLCDRDGRLLAPEERPSLRTLRTGQPIRDFVMGVRSASGETRWLLIDTNPLPRAEGPHWVVSSFVDITAQRRLEQVLASQTKRLHASLEGSRTAIWEWNVQTGETRFDERWAAIVGYTLDELQPTTIDTWMGLAHPDDLAASQALLQRHFAGEVDYYDIECRMRHRDGSWRWVRDRGRLTLRTADGKPLWMHGTHDDITERKQSEQTLARHHGLMRALFELSPLGLQLIDIDRQRVEAVNDALVAITGYSRDELLHGDGRKRFPPAAQAVRASWFADALAHGRFGPSEVEYLHGSGRIVNLVFHGVRVTDPQHAEYLWLSVQDVTERRAMERELRAAASEDRLTGLANRAAMVAALQRRLSDPPVAPGPTFGVMFLDFDRFKLVNDTLGHEAGDELLKAIAGRLRDTAERAVPAGSGAPWTVARFGGDEFVILLPQLAGEGDAGRHADAVLAALAEPYAIGSQEVQSTASIGIAVWQPGIESVDALLGDADAAMYEAKRNGRGRWVQIDDAMRHRLHRALRIESELRHAAARGQLSVAYQPIVDLETGALSSVEALMRWHHPELGNVSPAEFIPIAEESRLILGLGEWILRQACHQWAAWQREDAACAPVTVSVNLSRVQMTLGMRLLDTLRDALAEAGMPPTALQLEITEREVMKDPELTRQLMHAIAAMGVKLAMDDFGTGTSSLGCLRDYPFHTIKIDKTFVTGLFRDPHVLAVAHATINVIENLGMISVAEGIEEPTEVATLQGLGCRYGQGFHFARPLPADRVMALACARHPQRA